MRLRQQSTPLQRQRTQLALSSFFGKFDEEDDYEDDGEDDEDDEYDLDDKAVADFRTRMSSLFGESSSDQKDSSVDELISFATGKSDAAPEDWAKEASQVSAGCILAANPAAFCSDFGSPSPQLLAKFGLTFPPPVDLGPDRRADLLPVLMVTEHDEKTGSLAVLLNRRCVSKRSFLSKIALK
jgi:hypothetical protein